MEERKEPLENLKGEGKLCNDTKNMGKEAKKRAI